MRLSLRFVIPLLVALAGFAYLAAPLADALLMRWFVRDLELRANWLIATVQEPLADMVAGGFTPQITRYFNRLVQEEGLYAVGLCVSKSNTPIATANFPREIRCDALDRYGPTSEEDHVLQSSRGPLYLAARPITSEGAPDARLVLVHDMSFVERRSAETRRYLFYFFIVLGFCIALITVIIAQLSWRGWVQGMRSLLRGEGLLRPAAPPAPELLPIARDVRDLI